MSDDPWSAFTSPSLLEMGDFDSLAKALIDSFQLNVFGNVCRLLEIEFYLHSDRHADPFVHCDEAQSTFARWYLHRTGGTLKNGSFKGIDLAVGDAQTYFGILIRSLRTPSGVVCGPCLCVDYMIEAGEFKSIGELSEVIEEIDVRGNDNPVRFTTRDSVVNSAIYSCPRVGLSTKRGTAEHDDFAERNYRFMTSPRQIKKGRPELIRGLSKTGLTTAEIRELTGSPTRSIVKYSKDIGG